MPHGSRMPIEASAKFIAADDLHSVEKLRYRQYTSRKQRLAGHSRSEYDNSGEGSSRGTRASQPAPKRRIAIIGTGLAGLVAAHHLTETPQRRAQYEVHVFERGSALGLDAASFDVGGESGDDDERECLYADTADHKHSVRRARRQRVDVPMRSINAGYYPNLIRLYRRLGVPLRNNDFTFSFRALSRAAATQTSKQRDTAPFLIYNGQNGLRGLSLPSSQRARLASLMRPWKGLGTVWSSAFDLFDYVRFIAMFLLSYVCLLAMALCHHVRGNLLDPRHRLASEPLHQWAARHPRSIHPTFLDIVLVPLFSAVATSSHAAVLEMPAAEMLLYVATTFLRNHIAVAGGVKQVQDALTRHVDPSNIHLNASVQQIVRHAHDVTTSARFSVLTSDAAPDLDAFDHVIIATPASFAAALLQSAGSDLRHVDLASMQQQLARVKYETSTVVTHTDVSLLPAHSHDCRDLNLVTPALTRSQTMLSDDSSDDDVFASGKMHLQYTAATHVLGEVEAESKGKSASRLLLQTTNPVDWPAKQRTLSCTSFQRAITPSSKRDLEGLFAWQRDARPQTSLFNVFWKRFGWRQRDATVLAKEDLDLVGDSISEAVAFARRCVSSAIPTWLRPRSHAGSKDTNHRPLTLHLGALQAAQTLRDAPAGPCVWVCGSYAQGIPLLEGCVTSSTLVARAILCDARQDAQ